MGGQADGTHLAMFVTWTQPQKLKTTINQLAGESFVNSTFGSVWLKKQFRCKTHGGKEKQ
jgi:hypothetical protein